MLQGAFMLDGVKGRDTEMPAHSSSFGDGYAPNSKLKRQKAERLSSTAIIVRGIVGTYLVLNLRDELVQLGFLKNFGVVGRLMAYKPAGSFTAFERK